MLLYNSSEIILSGLSGCSLSHTINGARMVGFARYKIQIVIKNHTRVVHTEREVKIEFYVDKIRAFMDERGMQ